jgi:hypothetical protein
MPITMAAIVMLRTVAGSMRLSYCDSDLLYNITEHYKISFKDIIGDLWHNALGWETFSDR